MVLSEGFEPSTTVPKTGMISISPQELTNIITKTNYKYHISGENTKISVLNKRDILILLVLCNLLLIENYY
ncbi:MAG: hypothetical protein RI945_268 [Candidatus Parcubacteria bacterium]